MRQGLISKFLLSYRVCKTDHQVHSDDPTKKIFNVNAAALNASVSVGIGYDQTYEFLSLLEIPPMSKPKYYSLQNELVEAYNETTWSSMIQAGQEEKNLAIQNNEVDQLGRPLITVVADGAWSKRSYKTNYSACSGVAAIIGYRTKKILYLGVKNKYCTWCKLFGEDI